SHGHGSVSSPARLGHTGQFAGVCHFPQTDPAQLELAVDRLRSSASLASGVSPDLELVLLVGLVDECFLRHQLCPSRLSGKRKASSSARPSASLRAVVTMVMSIPRGRSILS